MPDGAPSSPQWTARSRGTRWQHLFFYRLIRIGGRFPAYAVMSVVVAWYVLFSTMARRRCEPYLRHRFGDRGVLRRWYDTYRLVRSFGETLVDRAAFGICRGAGLKVEFPQYRQLKELLDEGCGMVMVNSHVGAWQIVLAILGNLDTQVNIVMTREAGDIDLHYFEHTGDRPPFDIIDPRGYLGGVVEMAAALRRGQVVGLMGDRVFGEGENSASVPFLGGPVRFPTGPYRLAAMNGSPIAVLLSHKTGRSTYRLELSRVIRAQPAAGRDRDAMVRCVRQFSDALSDFVEAHPWQFFNFYDLWESS